MNGIYRIQLNQTAIYSTIRELLGHRQLPSWLALLAAIIMLPAVGQSWAADDLIHRRILLEQPLEAVTQELFVFAEPQMNAALIENGLFPWWTDEDLLVAFFRPLSAITHWVDYQLWPNSAALMYLQNIVWYCLLCLSITVLYRRLLPNDGTSSWPSGLAGLLFTTNVVHLGAVTWIASRNAIISMLFGVLALLAFVCGSRTEQQRYIIVAPSFVLLGLLSGEGGIAIGAYLLAYTLFLDQRNIKSRMISLAPNIMVILLWRGAYQQLGYGSVGSGFYIDPGQDLLRFGAIALERGPVLLASQWLGQVPLFYNLLSAPATDIAWIVSIIVLSAIGILLFPLVRQHSEARFWAAGIILCVIPACSIRMFSGRLLFFVALGVMGLLAHCVASVAKISVVDGAEPRHYGHQFRKYNQLRRGSVLFLLFVHIVLSLTLLPLILTASTRTQRVIDQVTNVNQLSATAGKQNIMIVNAPSPFNFIYLTGFEHLPEQPSLPRIRVLSPGARGVWLNRLDSQTIIVRPNGGYLSQPNRSVSGSDSYLPIAHQAYIYQHLASFFRDHLRPLQIGSIIELPGLDIEVTKTFDDGMTAEAKMHFAKHIDDPDYVWLQWDWVKNEYVSFTLPTINETVWIAGPLSSKTVPINEGISGE